MPLNCRLKMLYLEIYICINIIKVNFRKERKLLWARDIEGRTILGWDL